MFEHFESLLNYVLELVQMFRHRVWLTQAVG